MDATQPEPGTIWVRWGTHRAYDGEHEQNVRIPEGMTAEEFVRALHDDPNHGDILSELEKDDGECTESDRWLIGTQPGLPVSPEKARAQKLLADSRRVLDQLETVRAVAEHLIGAFQGAGIADLGTSLEDAEVGLEQMNASAQCAQQFYGMAAHTHEEALLTLAQFTWQHADTAETHAINISGDLQTLARELYQRGALPTHENPAVDALVARVLATGSYYDHAA